MHYDIKPIGGMLACPFCGEPPMLTGENQDERMGYAYVVRTRCTGCGAEQYTSSRTNSGGWNNEPSAEVQARAEAKWNRRTPLEGMSKE